MCKKKTGFLTFVFAGSSEKVAEAILLHAEGLLLHAEALLLHTKSNASATYLLSSSYRGCFAHFQPHVFAHFLTFVHLRF